MKLLWTRPALRDVEAIGDYIARDNPAAAANVVKAIFDQTDLLIEHPHIGRPGRIPETRELMISHTPFIVPYRVTHDTVEILAIFHSSRQWPAEFPE